MATIAVGDVHGRLDALDDLLARVTPELGPDDELVFLGDYVDRGPDSRGVLERLLRVERELPCRKAFLLGNHEEWLLRTLDDPTRHSWLLGMDGLTTVASYSPGAAEVLRAELVRHGPRLLTERVALDYRPFVDALPADHVALLRRLARCRRSPDVLCVHGGLDPACAELEAQDPRDLTWGTLGFPDLYDRPEPIVYGHHDDGVVDERGWPRPRLGPNGTFGIDTISHGVLTALRFPDRRVFQSARFDVATPAP